MHGVTIAQEVTQVQEVLLLKNVGDNLGIKPNSKLGSKTDKWYSWET